MKRRRKIMGTWYKRILVCQGDKIIYFDRSWSC